ncbi:MAG TPA: antibiotic biosynthesis monooxygenase family protein [Chitinophaga sp.]|uniref:antibiotic biosynthesis monooxygenase family protein n=1 Tax=Chitinophaga sp. TaxID=1869181 RepID=UPI002CBD73E2|nr:antibiotic biosynthesis monooxygenase family protein [Chitinophaga sp.]HVI47480.1 antibiotic biosynthesis monooxygenase family protein [Chitinophaga sp.]
MNKNNYSVEIIRYQVPAEQSAAFEKAYADAGQHLKASAYCKSYQVIHGNEEPENYIVIIHWTSKAEHLQGFRQSAEFMPFFALVKPFFNNIREMKHYDLTGIEWTRE